jgi:phosphatidylglycerol:prolipoprotein diacylglycerol transferase
LSPENLRVIDPVYVAIMLSAVAVGYWLSRRPQQSLPLDRIERAAIFVGGFCGAMLGAKLPFVLGDWDGLCSGSAWFVGGKTIMFGLVGGYGGIELAKAIFGIRTKTGDSYAVAVPAAVAIGRLGCFRAGCCYGCPSDLPWAVDFGDHIRRHPTQLYEAAFHASMAVILLLLLRRHLFRGQLIKLYFISYFVYRFATEYLRPEPRLWLGLTGYQWAALALAPLFALLWWHDAKTVSCRELSGSAPECSSGFGHHGRTQSVAVSSYVTNTNVGDDD